jgi:enterochelin esterase-like enzyme
MTDLSTPGTRPPTRRLAINRLRDRKPLDAAAVDRFLARHEVPIVEGSRCTFLYRGEADEVLLSQRIVGLPELIPLRRLRDTDLWFLVLELPEGSRVNYQLEIRRGGHVERINDPLNEKLSYSPVGTSSVCFGYGYDSPEWTMFDPDSRPGDLVDMTVRSRALRRDCPVTVYLPARFRRTASYPLLLVHDGPDFLQYAAAKTVLDNLIHRMDVAETVVAFLHPQDRLTEYANSTTHSRFLTSELLPRLETELPLAGRRSARCVMGSSFGAVASLSAAVRSPDTYGSLILMSGSFVFTDIGTDHGGGEVFDPVVKFVNKYRSRPTHIADRLFVSCGVYEPLIVPNRSMVPTFESAGMTVRYVEARDGHNWENWRDRLRDALSWVYPGPQKLYYE